MSAKHTFDNHEKVRIKCGCVNRIDGEIEFCPLHAAAPEMAEALRIALPQIGHVGKTPNEHAEDKCPKCLAKTALKKAGLL